MENYNDIRVWTTVKVYSYDGMFHRTDGPAIESIKDEYECKEYWLFGVKLSENEFHERIFLNKIKDMFNI
jgi:hypothetical protein